MNGPPPCNLVLLSNLKHCAPGAKVRFLGCVDEYVTKTATLRLKHNYPRLEKPKVANVNIGVVLESIKRREIDVGSWINVIGYVERGTENGLSVQAIAVWEAVNIDIEAYEKAIDARMDTAG